METPDVENIQGRNFFVYPGVEQTLTIRTTIINSTTNFDSMGIETRHCDENKTFREYVELEYPYYQLGSISI